MFDGPSVEALKCVAVGHGDYYLSSAAKELQIVVDREFQQEKNTIIKTRSTIIDLPMATII